MCFRFPRLALCALIGALAAGGCRREERNFATGGPRGADAATTTPMPPTAASFAAARGPQNAYENNAFALSQGKRLYSEFNCIGCHAAGGGDIGPALMDAKWLYGAGPANIYQSIMDGRPNGMPSFRGRITEDQARQLVAYVRSLSGQSNHDAATSRRDHMKTSPAENSLDREHPVPAPDPGSS